MKVTSDTEISEVGWISSRQRAGLIRLGFLTLGELLENFPRRHENRKRFDRFPDREMDVPLCLFGTVMKTSIRRFGRGKQIFEVVLEDTSAGVLSPPLVCRWFNAFYIPKMVFTGQQLVLFGRPKKRGKLIVVEHPEFETIDEEETSIHFDRIVPVHPAGEGVPPRAMRSLIHQALEEVDPQSVEGILPDLYDGSPRLEVLRRLHFPESMGALQEARRKLALEEFFGLQLVIQSRRRQLASLQGTPRKSRGSLLEKLREELPFPLTAAQERAIQEIRRDLELERPMHRLLQGDVGSGKTLVALASMLLAVESGCQAALMAPTQILAEQHYHHFKRLLAPLNLRVSLRTGGRREADGFELWAGEGDPHIIVGTHALLYEKEGLSNLGLAVIDEQHKFGVMQRARLLSQGNAPDLLVMTATPIPRTLALTIYGDLDVSVLDELPSGRGKIITGVRDQSKIPEAAEFIKSQLAEGRQGYIVYPLIEESEKLQARAATEEFVRWVSLLTPYRCELLHGRTVPEEKDAIMARFRSNETQVLVATTVIEVGIDVPNATVMLIENAERFGLAQLHQLRGRIGRGAHKSYCILLPGQKAVDAREKLAVLERTTDGFEIAEADLRLRGAGDMLGTAQSGLPPIRLGDLFKDTDLMDEALKRVEGLFEEDPTFYRHPSCADYLRAQEERLSRSG